MQKKFLKGTCALLMALLVMTVPLTARAAQYCNHCKSMGNYYEMKLLGTYDHLKCSTCGTGITKGIKVYDCSMCSDKCSVAICPSGHGWMVKG